MHREPKKCLIKWLTKQQEHEPRRGGWAQGREWECLLSTEKLSYFCHKESHDNLHWRCHLLQAKLVHIKTFLIFWTSVCVSDHSYTWMEALFILNPFWRAIQQWPSDCRMHMLSDRVLPRMWNGVPTELSAAAFQQGTENQLNAHQ